MECRKNEGNVFEHSVGEYVVYRNGCIYRIADIRREDLCGDGARMYYVMQPVFEERSLTYVPADSCEVGRIMRKVLSREQIDSAIEAAETKELDWPSDSKARAASFEKVIVEGDAAGTLLIFKKLSEYKRSIEKNKKKLYASDARILANAEKAVTEEFAFSLGIDKNQVIPYIKARLEAKEN